MSNKISLILVDPQVGFCAESGSLAKYYGREELAEVQKTVSSLKHYLSDIPRKHLITSEYTKAQFTDGNTQHPLANLCVPAENSDCDIVDVLQGVEFLSHHVKHQQSALSSISFGSEIDKELEQGVRHFVIAGFLFEHCVRATAEGLINRVSGSGACVSVCEELTASRMEKYANGEVKATIQRLKSLGVDYKAWQTIRP